VITHKIEKYPLIDSAPERRARWQFGREINPNSPPPRWVRPYNITLQSELEHYLDNYKYVTEGVFVTYSSNFDIKTDYQFHYIARVERDIEMVKEISKSHKITPFYVVSCHFYEDDKSKEPHPHWCRWESGDDFRVLTAQEVQEHVNDHLQNNLKRFLEKIGGSSDSEKSDASVIVKP